MKAKPNSRKYKAMKVRIVSQISMGGTVRRK